MANEKQDFGSIIEQWCKRFELIAKETHKPFGLTKGKAYHIRVISFPATELTILNDFPGNFYVQFDEVPDYFEIRIREA